MEQLGRTSIKHLWQLSDSELDAASRTLLSITEKVDGAKVTFGKDPSGAFFMAGGAGVPVYKGEDFVKHTISKTDDVIRVQRAKAYSYFFDYAKALLDAQLLPGRSADFEMFIKEIGKPEKGGIVFVKAVYPSSLIGTIGTLVRLDDNKLVGNKTIRIVDLPSISFYLTLIDAEKSGIEAAKAAKNKQERRKTLEALERSIADTLVKRASLYNELLAIQPEGFVLGNSDVTFKVTCSSFASEE